MFGAGCYEELYKKHEGHCPSEEAIDAMRFTVSNFSCRMSNVSASLAYPQIAVLQKKIDAHNSNYYLLQRLVGEKLAEECEKRSESDFAATWEALAGAAPEAEKSAFPQSLIEFVPQVDGVDPVYDSLQMRLLALSPEACDHMIKAMNKAGFKLQLFADKFNARYYRSWHYCVAAEEVDQFGQTDRVLQNVVDMRLLAHDTKADV